LLFETGTEDDYDAVWVVTADYEIRKKRVMERDGIDSSIIDLIMDSQDGEEKKVKLADQVIYNNGTLEELRQAVDSTLKSYGI
jgi:dephospho-CoA kinase